MTNTWKVILIRQPFLTNTTWVDEKRRAFERAYSLAELHGCNISVLNASQRIYVFAKAYYAPSKRGG